MKIYKNQNHVKLISNLKVQTNKSIYHQGLPLAQGHGRGVRPGQDQDRQQEGPGGGRPP